MKLASCPLALPNVATHDQRALDIFDTTYEMEDGTIRRGGERH
ncbi:MAG: hypothetical protein NTY19_13610 [Planctomycetota bacterium]|nr:hypothetical protein [Planctomycetota bacterium]